MKAKIANYSEAQIATITAMYTGADNKAEVKEIAEAVGKTVFSVRAKLSTMGIYKVAEKAEKRATATKQTKAELIGKELDFNEVEVEALTKTTVSVIDKILNRLTN